VLNETTQTIHAWLHIKHVNLTEHTLPCCFPAVSKRLTDFVAIWLIPTMYKLASDAKHWITAP